MAQKEILIVTQPFFPVPAINDGAIPFVIQDTLDCLNTPNIKVISIWDERMGVLKFDKKRFFFVNRKSLILRMAKRLFLKRLASTLRYKIAYTRYLDMLFGLIGYSFVNHPLLLVVHSTRCEWLINIKKVLSNMSTKIVWYHHMSEDQENDVDHLRHYPSIDGHIFVSDHSKNKFIEKVCSFDGLISKKSYVIKNGINTDLFRFDQNIRNAARDKYKISADTVVILYIGKITPRKGFDRLLDALRSLPEELRGKITVLAVGAADYYNYEKTDYINKMEEISKGVGTKIIFTGYIPHQEIVNYFCCADILVFPSIEEEGMPLTILEAQSVGLPVIASDVGGIAEVILHEQTGFIYSHLSEAPILSHYIEVLCNNPSLQREFAQRARDHIKANFTRERMARDFSNVLGKVLSA